MAGDFSDDGDKAYLGLFLYLARFDAAGKLRSIYPNLMQLDYDNVRTRMHQSVAVSETEEEKDPLTLAEELFVLQNNKPMSDGQREYLRKLARTVWEEER